MQCCYNPGRGDTQGHWRDAAPLRNVPVRMKHQLSRTAALVLALSLGACGLESEPLWLAMTIDKTIVAMDDSIRVTLAITNTSDRSVETFAESAYDSCMPGFEVVDESGRQVHMAVICTMESRPTIILDPGESLQVTSWWHPDVSLIGSAPVTPGLYTIRAAVKSDGEIVRSGAFDILLVE